MSDFGTVRASLARPKSSMLTGADILGRSGRQSKNNFKNCSPLLPVRLATERPAYGSSVMASGIVTDILSDGRELVVIASRDENHHVLVLTPEDWDEIRRAHPERRSELLRQCAIEDHDRLVRVLTAA